MLSHCLGFFFALLKIFVSTFWGVVRCIFMMHEFVNDSRMRQHMILKFIPWVQLLKSLKSDDLDIKSEVKFWKSPRIFTFIIDAFPVLVGWGVGLGATREIYQSKQLGYCFKWQSINSLDFFSSIQYTVYGIVSDHLTAPHFNNKIPWNKKEQRKKEKHCLNHSWQTVWTPAGRFVATTPTKCLH